MASFSKRRRYGTWGLPGRANASKSQAAFNFKEGYFEKFVKYEDPEVISRPDPCPGRGMFFLSLRLQQAKPHKE